MEQQPNSHGVVAEQVLPVEIDTETETMGSKRVKKKKIAATTRILLVCVLARRLRSSKASAF